MHSGPQSPPDDEPLRCEVSREDRTATILPVGELDIATAPVLDGQVAELRDAGFRHLILDLRGLSFMDSTGVRSILKYHSLARNDGFSIELIQGSRAIQRAFEVTGTTAQLPFIDT